MLLFFRTSLYLLRRYDHFSWHCSGVKTFSIFTKNLFPYLMVICIIPSNFFVISSLATMLIRPMVWSDVHVVFLAHGFFALFDYKSIIFTNEIKPKISKWWNSGWCLLPCFALFCQNMSNHFFHFFKEQESLPSPSRHVIILQNFSVPSPKVDHLSWHCSGLKTFSILTETS